MTSCMAVSETEIVVSSINDDKCLVYTYDKLVVEYYKNLTEHLGEAYKNMSINNRDLQKACAAFSSDGKLFTYNPNKGKLLSVWNTSDWSLVKNKTLAKHATNIVFTPKTNVIVVGDKKGDVYTFEECSTQILGHSSMVLDICFTADEKYIITCDSDEKIRVSHYPNGKNILYYMMGHEAYVSGICTINSFILSGSGDSTLRLWDLKNGELLDKINIHSPIQNVVEIGDVAAIQLYNSKYVHFVKTELKENKWSVKDFFRVEFEDNILNLASYGNNLWIIAGNSVNKYTVDAFNEVVNEDEISKMNRVFEECENSIKSFRYLENTNLMIFLLKKMIDKQKRIEQCIYNGPDSHHSKRIKPH